MIFRHSVVWVAMFGSGLSAADRLVDEDSADASKEGPQWVFSLLPKAFDPHPHVDYNVITEMTPAGRKAPKPTAQKPVYFELSPGGHLRLGLGATYNDKGPPIDELQRILAEALSHNHYLAATPPATPPSLLVIFHWGSHTAGSDADDGADPSTGEVTEESESTASTGTAPAPSRRATPNEINDFVERARLIGGDRFAEDLIHALSTRSASNDAAVQPRQRPVPPGMIPIPNIMGDLGGLLTADPTNPLEAFQRRDKNNMSLFEDAKGSIYFVLASAYDYASVAKGERVLLWRTKMTVNADGISMSESLLPLITSAGPHFGRDMRSAVVLGRRLDREGTVEVGTPSVIEVIETPPPAPAPSSESSTTP